MTTKKIILAGIEGNLEEMRNAVNEVLLQKAAEKLDEKKLEIAKSYFGKK